MGMGPGQPAKNCGNEELVAEFESACRGGDYEFAPEYRNELLRRLTPIPLPIDEWHEDHGDVLWWSFPITEPPYCGSPLSSDWTEDCYTYWTPIIIPELKPNYSIFRVDEDYIVAETIEQALAHHLENVGPSWVGYRPGEGPEVEMIPHEKSGRFETETGYEEKTFGEWLADFEYNGPQTICWNE